MVPLHETFGEILAAFQYGTLFRRTDDRNVLGAAVVLQLVVDAFHQWVFGSYHHHVDALLNDKALDGLKVVGLDVDILAHFGCTRIAWSNKQFFHFFALGDFPCQGMFPSSAS